MQNIAAPPKKFMRSDLKNSFQGESIWKMTNPEFFLTDPSSWLGQRWPRLGEAHIGAGSRKVKLNNEWGWGWRQKEFLLKIPRRGWTVSWSALLGAWPLPPREAVLLLGTCTHIYSKVRPSWFSLFIADNLFSIKQRPFVWPLPDLRTH